MQRSYTAGQLKKILGRQPTHQQATWRRGYWRDYFKGYVHERTKQVLSQTKGWDGNYDWCSTGGPHSYKRGDRIFFFDFNDDNLRLVEVKGVAFTKYRTPDGRHFIAYKQVSTYSRRLSDKLWEQLKGEGIEKKSAHQRERVTPELAERLMKLLKKSRRSKPSASKTALERAERTPQVRIGGYPAHWLVDDDGFEENTSITWSTGTRTKRGDIQVFAVSTTLGDAPELAGDHRIDSVHSIWKATTPPKDEYGNEEWPVQAKFKLLVKLDNPTPKSDLIRAGLLKRSWPRKSAGKILHSEGEVEKLGAVLAVRNPRQKQAIRQALNLE